MQILKWDENLMLGIKEIDEQHKTLVGMINDLHDAMSAGKGRIIMGDIINKLLEYTRVHFKYEETMIEKHKYTDLLNHKKEHNSFIIQINNFKNDFDNGNTSLSIVVMNFLKEWLKCHILEIDKKYSIELLKKV